MTDARTPRSRRPPARVPRASTTAAGAAALFTGAFGLMGWQMAHGRDPALGAGTPKPASVTRQALVEHRIVRRVVVTRVVTYPAPATPQAGGAAPGPAAPAPAPAAAAPVVRTSAPVVQAPAPAPVQTRTS